MATYASIRYKIGTDRTGTIPTAAIADDAITEAKIADDAIDSEHYTDGSIDNAHIADDAIDSEHYADGSIDNAHIADDAIDSEHYADGSIDNAHIADDAIDSEHYADGSIDTAHIADNQVTLAKMAGIARGKFIYGDASGDPAVLTVGSADTVLVSDGTDLSWGAAPGFASGTDMAFFQASAPTGWTKSTANNDALLRVVSGSGGGTGGSSAISSPAHNLTAASHTISSNEMPSHGHGSVITGTSSTRNNHSQGANVMYSYVTGLQSGNTGNTGGGGGHTHNSSGSITTPKYIDMIICAKD